MEGLHTLALSAFRDSSCIGSETSFHTVSIATYPSQPPTYQREVILEKRIVEFLTLPTKPSREGEIANATLQLVHIRRKDSEDLCVSSQTLHSIFETCRLDPSILYFINNNSYGLHNFGSETRLSSTDGSSCSFFVATVAFVLIWTFNPKTMTTRAIVLNRANNGLQSGQESSRDFETILTLYKDYIHTPCALLFVVIVHTLQELDALALIQLHLLRKVEAYTGHGAYSHSGSNAEGSTSALQEIGYWSTKVGHCIVCIANQLRHVEIVSSLIEFVDDPETDADDYRNHIDVDCLPNHDVALSTLQSALPVLNRRLQCTKKYNLYLQERARNQSSVLFGLLTHQDALINTKLARSSKEIAAATKRDGESMKTIAIMTMSFLPATFFAALFSVPSLQWDRRPVIQAGFGIYWAFTVPATISVFLVWFVLTKWSSLRDMVVRRVGRGNGTSESAREDSRSVHGKA